MKIGLAIGGWCLATLVAGCSSSSSGATGTVPSDASPDVTTRSEGGGGAVSVTGMVVDFTTSDATKNFDATKYPAVSGLQVCVYADTSVPSVPCVTTDTSGKYTLAGVPSGQPLYLSYAKSGFRSDLYGIAPVAGQNISAPTIFLESTASADSWDIEAGSPAEPTTGGIVFGANWLGPSSSPIHGVFAGTEVFYVQGFTVTISPAAVAGPIYTSASWVPDTSLTSSSEAGWGIFRAAPGDYTLTFTHPTMTCGKTTTKVVAGYDTTYVGVLCSPSSSGEGGLDGSSD